MPRNEWNLYSYVNNKTFCAGKHSDQFLSGITANTLTTGNRNCCRKSQRREQKQLQRIGYHTHSFQAMSAAKKYKLMDTTELHDTENISSCLKKGDSSSSSITSNPGGRSAFAAQNMNSAASTNGERLPNFSKLGSHHSNDIRAAPTTSNLLNRMGAIHNNKPGDVKKIVIKNFKGKWRPANSQR